MEGMLGVKTLLVGQYTCNCGNVSTWFDCWVPMKCRLVAVDLYWGMPGAEASLWFLHVNVRMNEWQTILCACCTHYVPYYLHAVHGVNSWSWHRGIERDDLTLCSGMMVMFWIRKRDGGWRWEQYGGYELIWEIRSATCLMGFRRPRIGDNSCQIGSGTWHIRNIKLTPTQHSLKSQFLMIMFRISSHLSLSCPQHYHHLRTWT